jgi:hypothetical protein
MKAFNENETEKYLDFNLHSQTLFAGEGDVAMVFPQLENGKVIELYAAVLTEDMTLLQLTPLNSEWESYKDALSRFQKYYSQPSSKFQTLKLKEIELQEVVIDGGGYCNCSGGDAGLGFGAILNPQLPGYFNVYTSGCGGYGMCGSGSSGSGSGDSSNTNPIDPCKQVKEENEAAKKVTDDPKYQKTLEEALAKAKVCKCETAFSFGWKDGELQFTPIKEGTENSGVAVNSSADFTVSGLWHYHPDNAPQGTINYWAPSPGDFYALNGSHTSNSNINFYLVGSDNSTYLMSIANLAQLGKFIDKNPRPCPTCANWKKDSDILNAMYEADDQFIGQGKNMQDSYAWSLAAVMNQFDLGISLSKLDANGNFQPMYVSVKPNPNGSPVPIYSQTPNCNL